MIGQAILSAMLIVTTPPDMADAEHPEAETWELTNEAGLILYRPGEGEGGTETPVAEYAPHAWRLVRFVTPSS